MELTPASGQRKYLGPAEQFSATRQFPLSGINLSGSITGKKLSLLGGGNTALKKVPEPNPREKAPKDTVILLNGSNKKEFQEALG